MVWLTRKLGEEVRGEEDGGAGEKPRPLRMKSDLGN